MLGLDVAKDIEEIAKVLAKKLNDIHDSVYTTQKTMIKIQADMEIMDDRLKYIEQQFIKEDKQ